MSHSTDSSKRLRRFEWTELVLHWANAVPFVTLLLTGGVIIAYRFLHFDASLFSLIRTIHKTTGIIWPTALACSFLFFGIRLNFKNIKQIFSLGLADIKWMIVAFRSLYHPELDAPPAGKFNTGQKINSILVVVYALLFPASGLVMWLHGTILISWYFHAALFFMAATSVGGHLYLSFINPSTRVGLGGIFHGWVPDYYIIHHHSLTLPQTEQMQAKKDKHALGGSFMKIEIIILVLTFVLGFTGLKIFNEARRASLARGFDALIAPNDLSKAHQIKEIDKCDKCHTFTGEIKDENCLKCHKIIGQRKEGAIGYHGKHEGPCRKCHKEHPGFVGKIIKLDPEKFDHNVADFKLEGKHREAKCDKCHKKWQTADDHGFYIGLKHDQCTDCHKDPHRAELGNNCTSCHSVIGWKGKDLKFDHDRNSKFHLEGKHRNLKCVDCHQPRPTKESPLATALFKNLRYDQCGDCHNKIPHKAEIPGDKCKSCHNMNTWKGKDLLFDHDRDSKYKLEGKHKNVKCVDCHQPRPKGAALATALFKSLKHEVCRDCHKDPHKGDLGDKCKTCHTMNGWKGKDLLFDHDRDAKYKLEGKHRNVKCGDCHPKAKDAGPGNASFKTKHDKCSDCHKDPHKTELGEKCKTCHNMNGWKGKEVSFEHDRDSKYKLEGKHKTAKCTECHTPRPKDAGLATAQFRNLKHDHCKDCHKDVHKGTMGATCEYCHTFLNWQKKTK